jgi:hypothetical protein
MKLFSVFSINTWVVLLLLVGAQFQVLGQSFYFGPKIGPSMGIQRWENFQQSPLFTYHGAFFIESYSESNPNNALYAQVGWHNRGSAFRNQRFITIDGDLVNVPTKNFVFSNAALAVGGKRRQNLNKKLNSYYIIGIRAEYTVMTNLSEYDEFNKYFNQPFYPDNQFVKKINYGVSIGGGFEYTLGKMVAGIMEISVHPDLSRQYEQPPLGSIPDPYNPGRLVTLKEKRIKNVTLEVSFGFRFLRKVVYLDY